MSLLLNLKVLWVARSSCLPEQLLTFEGGAWCIELVVEHPYLRCYSIIV